jgi:hypothetical protein
VFKCDALDLECPHDIFHVFETAHVTPVAWLVLAYCD